MTCLTLKKYILNLSVLISIYCVIVSYHICCNLTLHHNREITCRPMSGGGDGGEHPAGSGGCRHLR